MPNILDSKRFRGCLLIMVATVIGAPLVPIPVMAADAGLKRAERIDLRRLGSVTDDERDVLRIESRVGMSGVEEARSIREMLEKLRQMESTVITVGKALRSLPAERRAALPIAGEAEAEPSSLDWRLMSANIAALVLVALWWIGRRKTARAQREALANVTRELRGEPTLTDALPGSPQTMDARHATSSPVEGPSFNFPATTGLGQPSAFSDLVPEPEFEGQPLTSFSGPSPEVGTAASPDIAWSGGSDAANGDSPAPTVDFVLEEIDPNTPPPPPLRKATDVESPQAEADAKRNIEPTLHLAEIMLSMGLEQGAAQALLEYTEANPRDAVYHMLKLLGIYRKRGLHKEFQETAEKLRQHFNIQAEDWNQPSGEIPTLEKFTRIAEHVTSIWRQPDECIDYLRRLLEDNRDGARAGFPQSVAEEMLLLVEILKELAGPDQSAG